MPNRASCLPARWIGWRAETSPARTRAGITGRRPFTGALLLPSLRLSQTYLRRTGGICAPESARGRLPPYLSSIASTEARAPGALSSSQVRGAAGRAAGLIGQVLIYQTLRSFLEPCHD